MKRALSALTLCLCLLVPARLMAQDVVRIGNLRFAHYGAVFYLKGVAPKYGFSVEEVVFAKGADIYPAMAAGSIDLAASAADGAIAARGNGVPIDIVAGLANGGARILVRANSGIGTLADLKGRKVATARGGAHDLLFLASVAGAGLTWSDRPGKDVQLSYLGYSDLNQALASGLVDAICQSEPQATAAIQRGGAVELKKPYDTEIGNPVRALVMTEQMIRTKPDLAERVLKAFVAATRAFQKDPTLAERYVRGTVFKGALSEDEYRGAMQNASLVVDIDPAQVDVTAKLMARYGIGHMRNPPEAKDWVRLDLLYRAEAAVGP